MNRRQVVAALASVTCWSRAGGQAPTKTRVVALAIVNARHDAEGQARAEAFRKALADHGWVEGGNLRLELRFGADDPERARLLAAELVQLRPDVIVVNGSPGLAALQRATRSLPVVFVVVTDPLGSGYVTSLARPGGNITGFSTFAPEIGGKWVGLLKDASPATRRVACILDPSFAGFAAIWRTIQEAARSLDIDVASLAFRDAADDLETAVASFARDAGDGLIVAPTAINNAERERIISLAARHRLPAVYPFRHFAEAGGLMAYGFDPTDLFARSALYVDRILRGANPGDLPVQAPTRFEMVVNLKTARALNMRLPPQFLARADRLIE